MDHAELPVLTWKRRLNDKGPELSEFTLNVREMLDLVMLNSRCLVLFSIFLFTVLVVNTWVILYIQAKSEC